MENNQGVQVPENGAAAGVESTAQANQAQVQGNGGEDVKPATFEDMLKTNSDFQKELDRRINQAVETATSKERERQSIIQDQLQDEVLRVSNMTQEEKDAYFKQKADKEAADKEASLVRRELTLDARTALQDKHLPEAFLDLLDYTDKDACLKSIDTLEAAFKTAVQDGVNEKLKGGEPPKDSSTEGKDNSPQSAQQQALAEAMKIANVRTK